MINIPTLKSGDLSSFLLLLHCRVGSTFGHTHAANKQPGMGSRKYEKATTLPTSTSPSQTFDRDHQFSSKATLGTSLKSSSITSSSPSATAGSSFWNRSTAVPKFGSHPASTFQDFDDSVSDAWDIKDVKGMGYGGSTGSGIVIDVQPTSASPFSVAKVNSLGPRLHSKQTVNPNSPSSNAKNIEFHEPPVTNNTYTSTDTQTKVGKISFLKRFIEIGFCNFTIYLLA